MDLLEQLIAHVLVQNFLAGCAERIPDAVREFHDLDATRLQTLQGRTIVGQELCQVPLVTFSRRDLNDLLLSRCQAFEDVAVGCQRQTSVRLVETSGVVHLVISWKPAFSSAHGPIHSVPSIAPDDSA